MMTFRIGGDQQFTYCDTCQPPMEDFEGVEDVEFLPNPENPQCWGCSRNIVTNPYATGLTQLSIAASREAIEPYLGFGATWYGSNGDAQLVTIPAEHADWLKHRLASGLIMAVSYQS